MEFKRADATYIKNTAMKMASIIEKRFSHNELCKELMDIRLHEIIIDNVLSYYTSYYQHDNREMSMNDFIDKHKNGIFLSMIESYMSYVEILNEEIKLMKDKPYQIIIKTEEPLGEVMEKIKNNKPIKIK